MCDSSPQKWSSASEVDQQLKDVSRSYQLVIVDMHYLLQITFSLPPD